MSDSVVKYAKKHRKTALAVAFFVITTCGTLLADQVKRINTLEKTSISDHTKIDLMYKDVQDIKNHLLGAH